MFKRSSRLLAAALAAALVFTGAAAGVSATGVDTQAAAKSTVYRVTQTKDNSGDTIKYSYNKKGLVSKKVSTYKATGSDTDSKTVDTTTYKYNKKNRITKKTEKIVTTTTYYETDENTGQTITGTEGTVTYTTVITTKYTYNKKGLAKKSVTTTTYTQSGSLTNTDNTRLTSDAKQVSLNGSIAYVAGYNTYAADGTEYSDNTSANAYYYAGNDVASAVNSVTTTTEYTNDGDGSYTEKVVETTNSQNYATTDNVTVYRKTSEYVDTDGDGTKDSWSDWSAGTANWTYETSVTDNGNKEHKFTLSGAARDIPTYSSGTTYYFTYTDSKTGKTVVYPSIAPSDEYVKDASDNITNQYKYEYYTVINQRNIALTSTGDESTYSSTDTTTNTYTKKTTTTTTYKYDKKKRVKSEKVTEVSTGNTTTANKSDSTTTYSKDAGQLVYDEDEGWTYDEDEGWTYDEDEGWTVVGTGYTTTSTKSSSSIDTSSYTDTNSYSWSYSYGKNGKVKKAKYSNSGVDNYVKIKTKGRPDTSEETKTTYADGTVASEKTTVTYTKGAEGVTTTTTRQNGVQKKEVSTPAYAYTMQYNFTSADEKTASDVKTELEYTPYANGGSKTVKTITTNYKSATTDYFGTTDSSANGKMTVTKYSFDKAGNNTATVTAYADGYTTGYTTKYESESGTSSNSNSTTYTGNYTTYSFDGPAVDDGRYTAATGTMSTSREGKYTSGYSYKYDETTTYTDSGNTYEQKHYTYNSTSDSFEYIGKTVYSYASGVYTLASYDKNDVYTGKTEYEYRWNSSNNNYDVTYTWYDENGAVIYTGTGTATTRSSTRLLQR